MIRLHAFYEKRRIVAAIGGCHDSELLTDVMTIIN